MIKKVINKPLNENEKQKQPLLGEVSPEEAQTKANYFAALEKKQLTKK